jgi:hypothetical protein
MKKKIITILSILLLLLTTVGTTVVIAKSMNNKEHNGFFSFIFGDEKGSSLDELIGLYDEIKQSKQELSDLLESYGVELPELTNEQKRELFHTIRELRRNGNNREHIRSEINDILVGFGINIPDLTIEQKEEIRNKIRVYLEEHYDFVFIELTVEQKAYMKQTMIQLYREGANKEEVKDEIISLYEGYGGSIPELDESEREEIYTWIYGMIETDYNIDLSEITYQQHQEIKEKKDDIRLLQKELRQQLRQSRWITRFQFYRYIRQDRT